MQLSPSLLYPQLLSAAICCQLPAAVSCPQLPSAALCLQVHTLRCTALRLHWLAQVRSLGWDVLETYNLSRSAWCVTLICSCSRALTVGGSSHLRSSWRFTYSGPPTGTVATCHSHTAKVNPQRLATHTHRVGGHTATQAQPLRGPPTALTGAFRACLISGRACS